jgi:hypothetical protein
MYCNFIITNIFQVNLWHVPNSKGYTEWSKRLCAPDNYNTEILGSRFRASYYNIYISNQLDVALFSFLLW